jgi:hypothetical protein
MAPPPNTPNRNNGIPIPNTPSRSNTPSTRVNIVPRILFEENPSSNLDGPPPRFFLEIDLDEALPESLSLRRMDSEVYYTRTQTYNLRQ